MNFKKVLRIILDESDALTARKKQLYWDTNERELSCIEEQQSLLDKIIKEIIKIDEEQC